MPDDRDRQRQRAVRSVRAATDRARRELLARHRALAAKRRERDRSGAETSDGRSDQSGDGADGTRPSTMPSTDEGASAARHSTMPSTDEGASAARHSTVPRRPRGSSVPARERLYGERLRRRAERSGSPSESE